MQNARVLIVDDEPSNLRLLEELFHMHGAQVLAARDGISALKMAQDERPHLVLLDVLMPGMDGYEVCRRLKSDEATRRIPVVMITGLGELDDKIKGLDAGADDFLSKPVNAAELLTRSRSLLRVKELNDELEAAYHRLAEIASYTNELLRQFDPYHFDLTTSLKGLMEFLLRPWGSERTRPQRALLLSGDSDGSWSGWAYHQSEGRIGNRVLPEDLPPEEIEPLFRGHNLVYMNRGEPGNDLQVGTGLWEHIDEAPPRDNLVAVRSGSVAVLAMDFGKKVGNYDAQVISALVATVHFFLKTISSQIQEVEKAFLYTIGALARAAESHDEDTGNHIVRVNRYAEILARSLGCEEHFVTILGYSAQMHDVGKLHVHPDILRKPGPLNAEQWEEVKRHTIYGARILGEDARLYMAREVALSHHEHWDGSGYPYGLKGEDIPLSGRITMMADVYDALRCVRPYKPAMSHAQAFEIITKGDDRLKPEYFDPNVLKVFSDIHQIFESIYSESAD